MVSNYINSNYRITVSGVYLTENALENPNLVQVSVMADTFINVRPSGEAYSAGIRYQENGESPSWRLTGVNTRINNPDAHNIYARLRRDRDGESLITFDMRDRNIDGTVKGDSNSTIDPDFYYIKIGTLSATDSVENPTLKREITFDFGYYKTDSSNEEDSNGWRKLFELTQNGLINALKHFASFVVEGTITLIGRLEFGKDTGKYVNDIHRSFDNKDAEFTDTSVSSSLYIDNTYLNKTKADTAQAIITFSKGLISEDDAEFKKNVTIGGLAKTLNLEVEQLATIARCVVDIISSPVFVDGFFGEGFQIWKSLATGDWNMTIDRLTVRKVFTVFELLIQKMRSVGGMLVVSAADGKIETVERVGDDYRITFASGNGFQANDLIRHQIFSGNNVEHYWTKVKSVDGNNVIIPVSEFEGVEPQVGDECVLMGNTKNKLRQSLITISAVEDGQPRIDVLSGVNSKSFEGKLVTRLGNMDGIKDIYFPADNQPHGDGLYGTNCYLRGTFLLVTGEDILTKFLVMENMFRSEMENLRNEIQEKDNYLSNSAFASDTDRWETTNDIRFFTVGGKFLFFNGNFYSNKKQVADIIKLSTRNVLRIKASGIKQTNADLARKPKYNASDTQGNETAPEFFVSFRVRVLDHGVVTIGFPGQGLYHTETLEPTDEFIQKEYSGTWDGTGDFEMKFTGDAYFYSLALTDNAFEEMYTKFSTKIEQTNERIELLATATSEMGDKLQSSIEVTAKDISLVSEKTNKLDNTLTSMGIVIDGNNGNIRQFVKKDGVISSINQTSESVSIDASKINLNGAVTFSSLNSSLSSTIHSKADASALGSLAYKSAVEAAELGSTIVVGGYLNTEYIKVKRLDAAYGTIAKIEIAPDVNWGNQTGIYFNSENSIIRIQPLWITEIPDSILNYGNTVNAMMYLKRRRNNSLDRCIYVDGVAEIYGRLGALKGLNTGFNQNASAIISEGIYNTAQMCLRPTVISSNATLDSSMSLIFVNALNDITLTLPTDNLTQGQMYFIRKVGGGNAYVYGKIMGHGEWGSVPSLKRYKIDNGNLSIFIYNPNGAVDGSYSYWTENTLN